MFEEKKVVINGYDCLLKLVVEENKNEFTRDPLLKNRFYVSIEIYNKNEMLKIIKSFSIGTEKASNEMIIEMVENVIKEAKNETENLGKNNSIINFWNELDLETLF